MSGERDVRPCPICAEPVDVTDWPSYEASACESCGAFLFIAYDDELIVASKVEY